MTKLATPSAIKLKDNCGSAFPLILLGALALTFGVTFKNIPAIALGITLVVVPGVMYAILRIALHGVTATRVAPTTAFEGDEIEIKLVLKNGGRFSLFQPMLTEIFIPEIHTQKHILFPFRVRPREVVEASYRGRCVLPRGIYDLGPTLAVVADPFGWFQLRKTLPTETQIKVYPRFDRFGVEERRGSVHSLATERLTRLGVGQSTEFFSVREYRVGDPFRRLHWPLTAHRGFPVVREFARPATGDLFLYLDLYRYGLLGIGRGSSLEHSVRIVASLASHSLRLGHRVQLNAWGGERRCLPLGIGRQQLQKILDQLVVARPDGDAPLDKVLRDTAQDILPGATVVLMVSPYLRKSRLFDAQVRALKGRGTHVSLVIFDDSTFRNIYALSDDREHVEQYLQRMRSLGVRTYLVPCAANLPAIFAAPATVGALR